jgi:C1A family cysteine protease
MSQQPAYSRQYLASHPEVFPALNESLAHDVAEQLARKGIVDVGQLYSLLLIESLQANAELTRLLGSAALELTREKLQALLSEEDKRQLEAASHVAHPFGLLLEERFRLLTESQKAALPAFQTVETGATPANLEIAAAAMEKLQQQLQCAPAATSGLCGFNALLPVLDQGQRPTCVAFATTYANQYYSYAKKLTGHGVSSMQPLSQQYVYAVAKSLDSNEECGTTLTAAVQVLTRQGQCELHRMHYVPAAACSDNGVPIHMAVMAAASYKAPCIRVRPNDINCFKAAILSNGFVVCGLPVFPSWAASADFNLRGIMSLPFEEEESTGGHALTIVGFEQQEQFAGGGYFIAKNSWGPAWAPLNVHEAGYALIPYELIAQQCLDAYTIVWPYPPTLKSSQKRKAEATTLRRLTLLPVTVRDAVGVD